MPDPATGQDGDENMQEDLAPNDINNFAEQSIDLVARLNQALDRTEELELHIEELKIQLDDMQKLREKDQRCEAEARREMWHLLRSSLPQKSDQDNTYSEALLLMLAGSGGKIYYSQAKKLLGMKDSNFSRLVSSLSNKVILRRMPHDKRQKIIQLRSEEQ